MDVLVLAAQHHAVLGEADVDHGLELLEVDATGVVGVGERSTGASIIVWASAWKSAAVDTPARQGSSADSSRWAR